MTEPEQSVVGVRTAAAKPHCCRLAGVPPITLLRASGLACAALAASSPTKPVGQRAAAPALAIRESTGAA